jgi:hypothetical protein
MSAFGAFSSHPPAPYVCAHEPEKGAAWANNFACIQHGVKSGGAFQRPPLSAECVGGWRRRTASDLYLSLCTLNQTHERVREAVAGL